MVSNVQKAAKGLRHVRQRYDTLLKDFGGKRPTNYAKLRQFCEGLILIVEDETVKAGLGPAVKPIIKGVTVDRPETAANLQSSTSGIGEDFGGKKILPLSKPKKSKAEIEREERKKHPKPVFIPPEKRKAAAKVETEEDEKAAEEAARKAKEEAEKEAKEIEMAAAKKLAADQKAGIKESRGVTLRDDKKTGGKKKRKTAKG